MHHPQTLPPASLSATALTAAVFALLGLTMFAGVLLLAKLL